MDSCRSPLRKVVKVLPDTHLKRDLAHIINIIKSERLAIQTPLHVASSNYSCIFDDEDHIIIQCDLETPKQCLLLYHAPNETKLVNVKPYAFDKDAIKREMKCAICLDYMSEPMTIKECSHSYCKACLVTHLAVSKICPLCPWVHVNSKRDAWHNIPLEKIINVYKGEETKSKSDDTTTRVTKSDTIVATKKKRDYRCSVCQGLKSAPAQKCSFPCTEGALCNTRSVDR
jgi:hypothetical protein